MFATFSCSLSVMSVHILQISRPFCPTQIGRQLHFSASWRDLSRLENISSTCCLKQCQFSLRLSPSQCIWEHSMLLRAIVLLFLLLLLTPCKILSRITNCVFALYSCSNIAKWKTNVSFAKHHGQNTGNTNTGSVNC